MKTKHTPGPWNEDGVFICDDEDNIICELYEINANARLIAAAPELLEALEEVMDEISGRIELDAGTRFRVRAAIRKALGEEK